MTDKSWLLTLERKPFASAEILREDEAAIENSQVRVLIPSDQHTFRERANQDRRMILQVPGREPYRITIEDFNGGRFRVDGKA